jgi:hypothetical protein
VKEGAAAADAVAAAAPVFVTALAAGFTAWVEAGPRVDAGFTAAAAVVAAVAVFAVAGLFAAATAWTAAAVAAAAAVLADAAELLSSRRLLPPVLLLLSAAAHPVAAPSDTNSAVSARLGGDVHMQYQMWFLMMIYARRVHS